VGKNDVNIRLAGDSGDAQRAWTDLIGVVQQMDRQLEKMGRRMEKNQRKSTKAMEEGTNASKRFFNSLKSFGTAYYALDTVKNGIRMINQEIEAGLALGKKKGEVRLSYEQELQNLTLMMGTGNVQEAIDRLNRYQGPIDRASMTSAASAMISSGPRSLTRQQLVEATVQTGEAFPNMAANPEGLKNIASAVIQLSQASPELSAIGKGGKLDLAKPIAFFQAALTASRQESAEQFARFSAPTIRQLSNTFGWSPQAAVSLISSTQTAAGDSTGRMGSTGAIIFAEKLQQTAARFGRGELKGEGILSWLHGSDESAVKARRYLFGQGGAIDGMLGKRISEMSSNADISGRQGGAARYRRIFGQIGTGTGKVWDEFNAYMQDMAPENVAAISGKAKAFFETSPEFNLTRERNRRLSMTGESSESTTAQSMKESFLDSMATLYENAGISRESMQFGIASMPYKYMSAESFTAEKNRELMQNEVRGILAYNAPRGLPRLGSFDEYISAMQGRRGELDDRTTKLLDFVIDSDLMGSPRPVRIVDDEVRANEPATAAAPSPAEAISE